MLYVISVVLLDIAERRLGLPRKTNVIDAEATVR